MTFVPEKRPVKVYVVRLIARRLPVPDRREQTSRVPPTMGVVSYRVGLSADILPLYGILGAIERRPGMSAKFVVPLPGHHAASDEDFAEYPSIAMRRTEGVDVDCGNVSAGRD